MKYYWFYVELFVVINVGSQDSALFYNTLNNEEIDNMNNLSFKEMAFKEMMTNDNWRRLRKNISICENCVYNFLCPDPSNYELVIGKNNLCNIL